MDHNVLIIDDEDAILNALKRVLRSENYHCDYTNNPLNAIELAKNHTYSVILSDMKMPNMTGSELFEKINSKNNITTKMILSAYSDQSSILNAINKGNIWRFIIKPWDDDELKITIQNALELYEEKLNNLLLTKQLKERNKQLEILNNTLEETVESRTIELTLRTKILEKIINGDSIQNIIPFIEESINQIYPNIQLKYQKIISDGVHIKKGNKTFGEFQFQRSIEKKEEELVKTCASLLSISFALNDIENNSEGLAKNIDAILNEL